MHFNFVRVVRAPKFAEIACSEIEEIENRTYDSSKKQPLFSQSFVMKGASATAFFL